MNEQNFSYYSKNILNGMNTVEGFTEEMFHVTLPEFEKNFWLAHDQKDIKQLRVLNETMNKIIDDLKAGNSFVLDRVKAKGAK